MRSIILSSQLCKDTYPNNSGGEFSNYLNHPINTYNTLVAITEIYYVPRMWYNVRPNFKIFIKVSGHYFEANWHAVPPAELVCSLEPGYYVDEQDLVEKILYAINLELWTYFRRIGALIQYHLQGAPWSRNSALPDWLKRQGNHMRQQPRTVSYTDPRKNDEHTNRALIQEDGELYAVPPNWDVNLLDGRYIAAVIIGGKVVFKPRNYKFDLSFAFSKELAFMIGATPMLEHPPVWFHNPLMHSLYTVVHTNHRGIMIYEDGKNYLSWDVYIDHDITPKYVIDLYRNTMGSIWVCCNIIEQTNLGHDAQLPMLRCIPAESGHGAHTNHCFVDPQYCKVIQSKVECIKIWLLEVESSHPLVINGDVHVRLEFQNAK
jgi:hypothetical protein